jgi:hypothetical protein
VPVELPLLLFFSVCWVVAIVVIIGGLSIAGVLPFSLYHYFGLAAFGGGIAGNVFVHRSNRLGKGSRRWLLLVYLFGPLGALALLDALGPVEQQRWVPLAPIYAFGIFGLFFLVPVSLRPRGGGRRGKST